MSEHVWRLARWRRSRPTAGRSRLLGPSLEVRAAAPAPRTRPPIRARRAPRHGSDAIWAEHYWPVLVYPPEHLVAPVTAQDLSVLDKSGRQTRHALLYFGDRSWCAVAARRRTRAANRRALRSRVTRLAPLPPFPLPRGSAAPKDVKDWDSLSADAVIAKSPKGERKALQRAVAEAAEVRPCPEARPGVPRSDAAPLCHCC